MRPARPPIGRYCATAEERERYLEEQAKRAEVTEQERLRKWREEHPPDDPETAARRRAQAVALGKEADRQRSGRSRGSSGEDELCRRLPPRM
jgi:hypothetical protein